MFLCHASRTASNVFSFPTRRSSDLEARYASDGDFVPLDRQDTALWSQSMIDEAETHLHSAAANHRLRPKSRVLPIERHKIDRKSTRLNSSHGSISYSAFCLKKKQNA